MSYQQVLIRRALAGDHVRDFMKTEPVTVPPSASVEELVRDYFYRYHYKMFPVSDNGNLAGCISSKEVKDLPKEQWTQRTVADLARPCSQDNTVSPDTDAMQALSKMNRTNNSRLMVTDGRHLVGIITLKDLLKFLDLKMDLEGS
jgi:predicted transcriptional regulator